MAVKDTKEEVVSNLTKFVLVVVVAVGLFLAGRTTAPAVAVEEGVETIYDTVRPPAPPPIIEYVDEYKELYFDLRNATAQLRDSIENAEPYIIYDTITKEVAVHIPMQRYTFADSLYTASMVGYNVHDFDIELRVPTTTIIQTHNTWTPPKYEIFAEAGFDTRSQWLGVGYKRNWHPLSVEVMAGVEPFTQNTYVAARARINIFSKK